MMPSVEINWVALFVAAVISVVIGSLWYAPALFGKQWQKLTGKRAGEMGNGGLGYGVTILGSFLQAFILVHFVRYAGAITAIRGAEAGFWLWLGFVAIASLVHHIFEGRPWRLWRINAGYFLAVLVINGALLAAWR
jgi:hypothetical protein